MDSKFPELGRTPIFRLMAIVSVLVVSCLVVAEEVDNQKGRRVTLQGILGSKVVMSIDGERALLTAGEMKDGVKIIKIYPNSVDATIDGKSKHLKLGGQSVVSSPYKKREVATVVVAPDALGMYTTVGTINDLPVSFLVDTGATTIAMNAAQAKRLGIDFRIVGNPAMVGTASGISKAYHVVLKKVSIGSITLNNIHAVVLEGEFPQQALLGMSFLGQLELKHEGSIMKIRKKY